MSMSIKKICNAISIVIVFISVTLAVLLAGVKLLGLQTFSVLSGSMEPDYPVGSLIYVKKADVRDIRSGDVITFMVNENTVATHRVTEVLNAENSYSPCFKTKGDANSTEDAGTVQYRNVIGKPVFSIPYLGYLACFFYQPTGKIITLIAAVILIAFTFLPDMLCRKKDNRQSTELDCR